MTVIPIVQGNLLRLAIPLQREIVSLVNGRVDISYEDFVPTGPVTVVLTCGNYAAKYKATMDDELTNVAHIEDNGTLPVGVYSITIRCRDENTKPMRYKKRAVVNVVDTTAEAGITPGIEFEAGTQWLDAAVFLAFGGGGGTGEETDPIFSASPAAGITQAIIDYWNAKQEAIGDLGQIRAGAAAGATALQPGALDGYATSDAVNRAIARIQSSIDELMGADDVTVAINTFNEIVAFLDSVENTETLAGIIAGLNTAIAAKYTKPGTGIPATDLAQAVQAILDSVANKANSADVYTKSQTYSKDEVNAKVADAGKVKSVTINGTKKTPNETTGDVDLGTIVGQQGPQGEQGPAGPQGPKGDKGDTVVVGGEQEFTIVNDLTTGGASDALSAEMGKELNLDVNGLDFVGTWSNGLWPNTSGLSVGGTYSESTPDTSYASAGNYRYCKKFLVGAGMNYRIVTECNIYHRSIVITKTDGEIVYLGELNRDTVDYTTSFEYDVIVYVNAHKDFTDKSVTFHIDGLEQRVEEVESKTSQVGELSREVGIISNAVNGYHVFGEWSIGCWTSPSSIAVGGTYTGVVSDLAASDGAKYDHCERLALTEGQTLVVKAKCDIYHQTLIITKLDGEVVYASGGSEVDQSFEIEHDGYAYVNKQKAYTGQKAEIHVYSQKEYTDEKFEAVSDFVDQQKLVGELFLSGYAFFGGDKGIIFNPRGYALNEARIYIYQVVSGQKFSKIIASSFIGHYVDYVFTDNAGRILETSSIDGYNTGIRTISNVTAPEGATRLYVSENTTNGEGTSAVYASVIESDAMVAVRNLEATKMKISAEELVRYYHLGAQKMDTYNLVREKVGIITIGQSNIDGRIAAADFPATANINGTDISLAKSIPTCKFMKGTADSSTYDEATRSFAAYNNAGSWSFDQVVYNAIANALGSETDFYVCKQSRGGTSIGYAQYTSFCADIDDFKFYDGRDWSQLYHLKCLVKRALELQPDLKFKAIIMHQGEQDENIVKTSGTYYINLCRLIQWIRGLVGSPKLPFIFGSIPTNSSSFNQIIYDDMVRVAADLNDVYLVEIGEAPDWVDDQWHSGTTGLHFGANTAVKLADDMYKLMVSRKMLAPYV